MDRGQIGTDAEECGLCPVGNMMLPEGFQARR